MFLSLIIIIIMFNRKLYDTYHIIPNPEERREITWIVSSKYISFTKELNSITPRSKITNYLFLHLSLGKMQSSSRNNKRREKLRRKIEGEKKKTLDIG